VTSVGRAALAVTLLAAVTALGAPLYRGAVEVQEVPALASIARAFAAAAAGTLELLGIAVVREGANLRHPSGFSIQVSGNCTAWFHAVLFLAGLFALKPETRRGRGFASFAVWSVGGVGVIAAVNLVRLVLIFVVGARVPALFDWSHHVVGEALLAGTVLLLCWRASAARECVAPALALAVRAE